MAKEGSCAPQAAPARESLRAALIPLAAYGEEEFLIGMPGSNLEGVLAAAIERFRARPSEPSFFDSCNRSLRVGDFPRSQGLSQTILMPYRRLFLYEA